MNDFKVIINKINQLAVFLRKPSQHTHTAHPLVGGKPPTNYTRYNNENALMKRTEM